MTRPNNTSFRPCQVTGNLRIRVRSRGSFTWITIISGKYTCLKKHLYVSKPAKKISCDSFSLFLCSLLSHHWHSILCSCMCVLGISTSRRYMRPALEGIKRGHSSARVFDHP
ncbi:hypothetical protein Syun_024527 [Stephania yunnanensis]|uniref:Uncharacterized protein n=1 Tax=Stephania yunnanensis TaxID=152371 RepID=A0AAP0I4I2_9MAGN